MPRVRAARLALFAFGVAMLAMPAASLAAPARPPRPIQAAFTPLQIFADTLVKKQGSEVAHAWADSVGKAAAARGDRALAAAATLWRGKRYAAHEAEYDRAAPYFTRAFAEARALRDTFALALGYERRGLAGNITGRKKQAVADWTMAVTLARRGRLPEIEGAAHLGLGNIAKLAGDYEVARRELAAAVRLLPEKSFDHLYGRLMLGEMLNRTGHPDEARERFEEVLAEAWKRKNRWTIAAAMHDLANVAFEQGDMAEADRQWAQAAAHYDTLVTRKVIDRGSGIFARTNRAHALVVLGRLDEAEALLVRLIEESALVEDPRARITTLRELAVVLRRGGRLERAEHLFRTVRAASAGLDSQDEETSSIELAGLLRESGRLAAADDLLDSLLAPAARARLTAAGTGEALAERSAVRRALGRPGEALVAAREAERVTRTSRTQPSIIWLDAVVELARSQRAAGRPDEAIATLRRASGEWERWRAKISNFEWRERAGSGLAGLFTEYGLALLDPRRPVPEARRAREAFDALQVFQARTLEERMKGAGLAGRAMARRATADSLRRGVLAPGEALLDLVATPDTTFAFIVTRAGTSVRLLPGTRRLDALFDDWRGAMLSGAATPVVERGLKRLSAELLGPVSAPLRDSRRIVVSGGGSIALWPLAALTLPGEATPLGERREIVSVPSATLFTLLRARRGGGSASEGLLALSRTTDAAGRALPGVERELAMLDRTFERVTLRRNGGERTVRELTTDLAGFSALHFAAHAEAKEATPWRSGFLLGKGAGNDAYLRASNVARLRLNARLAVLSGCQSAGATALAGEGALGLSSAFLSAGTRTVVATLWPVEDRVAERWMAAFYGALAAGRPVATAAREAGAALRAHPATANPRDWAAFVVLGEPGTIFPLRPRPRA